MFALSVQEKQDMNAAIQAGRLPNGTVISMADRASHLVFGALTGVREIQGPRLSGVRRDVTSHNSGGWQELLSVLRSGGEVRFVLLVDDSHAELLEASLAQTEETFQLALTNLLAVQFTALVELDFRAGVVGALRADVKLTLTGAALRVDLEA